MLKFILCNVTSENSAWWTGQWLLWYFLFSAFFSSYALGNGRIYAFLCVLIFIVTIPSFSKIDHKPVRYWICKTRLLPADNPIMVVLDGKEVRLRNVSL